MANDEYIILPATYHHVVLVYTRKDKITLITYWTGSNLANELANTVLPESRIFNETIRSRTLTIEEDRIETAESALNEYTEYLQKIIMGE